MRLFPTLFATVIPGYIQQLPLILFAETGYACKGEKQPCGDQAHPARRGHDTQIVERGCGHDIQAAAEHQDTGRKGQRGSRQ